MDGYYLGLLSAGHNTRHLLQFNQKPPLIKPTSKCEVQVSMMTSEFNLMLSEGPIELGHGNKGFFTYPFLILKKNRESHFIMNVKPLNQYIACTKFKMMTLKQIREAIHPGQWAVSLDIKSAYCNIPTASRHHCFLHFQWKGKVYQFRTLPFGLSTAPKTFTRVMKPILSPMLEDGYNNI